MRIIEQLNVLRRHAGKARTTGLPDEVIARFAERDPRLVEAVEAARDSFEELRSEMPELLALDEAEQIRAVQSCMVNFYAEDAVNPYVSLAARGPWIVTLKGAVLHDSGGYGMLGFGHSPESVLEAMSGRQVMANVMTPNLSQKRFTDALLKEIGHRRGACPGPRSGACPGPRSGARPGPRSGDCPFSRFLFLNSGSEAVSVAARIADINAKQMTDPGGRYADCRIRKVGLTRAFHGRTERPAQFSDSTRKTYSRYLATFRDNDSLITVAPNDCQQLEQVFGWAASNGIFIEALFLEPVMGEGNPGQAITAEFYDLARRLTREHGALMLVDSIQAGLRAHGVLSICDYPGFESLDAPDMETYSKALNAGQYPLSVLAMTRDTAALYRKGVYGNTMSSNPRAMDVGCAVLEAMTPQLRDNIIERGRELLDKFGALEEELGGAIKRVQGTGLLVSLELDGDRYRGFGQDSIEEYMRIRGINVIHGGENALRFTPQFAITSDEIDLIVDATRDALLNGPVKSRLNEEKSESASVAAA